MKRLFSSGRNKEVLPTVHDCCERAVPAMVISPDVGVCCRARFSSVAGESVTFDLLFDWAAMVFMPLSLCCVTFNGRGRSHVFLGSVVNYTPPDGTNLPQLMLELPKQVVAVEARRTTRIPVDGSSGLSVQLVTADNRVWVPTPRDISPIGMLVEFAKTNDADIAVGAAVGVELALDGDVVKLEATVRRRFESCYGLFFSGVMKKGKVCPPEPLCGIVDKMEQRCFALPKGGTGSGPTGGAI